MFRPEYDRAGKREAEGASFFVAKDRETGKLPAGKETWEWIWNLSSDTFRSMWRRQS